jgi:hypothetical protein
MPVGKEKEKKKSSDGIQVRPRRLIGGDGGGKN